MDKMMYIFPGICDYFLAGIPKGEFINDFIKYFTQLLMSNSAQRMVMINQQGLQRGNLDLNSHYHLYSLGAHLAVQAKQTQLNTQQN